MVPGLAGPLPVSFWAQDIPQAAHQEPAILHAAVAMSTLYKEFKFPTLQADTSQRRFALQKYNKAIRCIVTSQVQHIDSVVLACIMFNGIEFFRGNVEAALKHYQHGLDILASYKPSTRLISLFRRFNVFILLYSHFTDIDSIQNSAAPPMDSPFDTLAQAKESLDWFAYRAMKMALASYQKSYSSEMSVANKVLALISSRGKEIDQGLDAWSRAASHFALNALSSDEKEAYHVLKSRWRLCKIFMSMSQCVGVQVPGGESSEVKFGRVLEIIYSMTRIDPLKLERARIGLGFVRLLQLSMREFLSLFMS
ncbi:C6 zinc finger domain-containing protein [Penicillium herquei]|nr:C6 zinc finger domain-containing protein [Penicillium herquei]